MNRRKLLLSIPHAIVGTVVAARLVNNRSPAPVARLVNNEKGTWYNGRATEGNVCQGEDALIYEPDDLTGTALRRWWEDTAQLVEDDYAEWI